jgi:hypothetical protein
MIRRLAWKPAPVRYARGRSMGATLDPSGASLTAARMIGAYNHRVGQLLALGGPRGIRQDGLAVAEGLQHVVVVLGYARGILA